MYSKSLFVAITFVSLVRAFIIENLLPHKFSLCICIGHECAVTHALEIHAWKSYKEEKQREICYYTRIVYIKLQPLAVNFSLPRRKPNMMNSWPYFKCMEILYFRFVLFKYSMFCHRECAVWRPLINTRTRTIILRVQFEFMCYAHSFHWMCNIKYFDQISYIGFRIPIK